MPRAVFIIYQKFKKLAVIPAGEITAGVKQWDQILTTVLDINGLVINSIVQRVSHAVKTLDINQTFALGDHRSDHGITGDIDHRTHHIEQAIYADNQCDAFYR